MCVYSSTHNACMQALAYHVNRVHTLHLDHNDPRMYPRRDHMRNRDHVRRDRNHRTWRLVEMCCV